MVRWRPHELCHDVDDDVDVQHIHSINQSINRINQSINRPPQRERERLRLSASINESATYLDLESIEQSLVSWRLVLVSCRASDG